MQAGAFQKNGVSSAAGTTITTVNGEVTSATTNIDIFNFGGNFFDPSQASFLPCMLKLMLHEIGHTMGLNDVDVPNPNANCGGQTAGNSVMNGKCGINDAGGNMPKDVKNCDNQTVTSNTEYAQGGGGSGGGTPECCDLCFNIGGICEYTGGANCTCSGSPIIIDILGDGFSLTDRISTVIASAIALRSTTHMAQV